MKQICDIISQLYVQAYDFWVHFPFENKQVLFFYRANFPHVNGT